MRIGYLDTNNKNNTPFIDFIGKLSRININPSILILAGIDIKSAKKIGKIIRIGNSNYKIELIYTNKTLNEKTLILINEFAKNEINIIDNKTNQFIIQNKNKSIIIEPIHWPNYNETDASDWINEFSKQNPKKHKIADILIGNFGIDLLKLKNNSRESESLKTLIEYFAKLNRFLLAKPDVEYTFKTGQQKKILDYIFSKYNGHIAYSPDIITNHKYMEFLLDTNFNFADSSMSAKAINSNLQGNKNIIITDPGFTPEEIKRGCNECDCYKCKLKNDCIIKDENTCQWKGLKNCKRCFGQANLHCQLNTFLNRRAANKDLGMMCKYKIQDVINKLQANGFSGIDTRNDKYNLPHLKAIGKNRVKYIEFGLPNLNKIEFVDGSASNAFYNTRVIDEIYDIWSEIVELGCDTIGKGVW